MTTLNMYDQLPDSHMAGRIHGHAFMIMQLDALQCFTSRGVLLAPTRPPADTPSPTDTNRIVVVANNITASILMNEDKKGSATATNTSCTGTPVRPSPTSSSRT